MRVLVTRTEPQASRTAVTLKDNGFEPVVWPLFRVRDLGVDLSFDGYDALIFTSAHAPEILAGNKQNSDLLELPAFCVGDRTAEAANACGFRNAHSAGGNAQDLIDMILGEGNGRYASFLYPAAVDRAFDIVTPLQEVGLSVTMQEVYAIETVYPDRPEIDHIINEIIDGFVLVYSNRTGLHLADVLASGSTPEALGQVDVVAISEKASRSVLQIPWRGVYTSKSADEPSMIDTLKLLTAKEK